tara:strand:- start:10268 stop:11278 length:1011 start_codon:yes stop_codon:yes gene_type:complete
MIKKPLINFKDKIYLAGHKGMVGSAIHRSLLKKGYENIIFESKDKLNLLEYHPVKDWFEYQKPDVVIIAAAKVGGINANNTYSYDFLIENLKIQNNIIENAWKNGVKRLLFLGSSCIYPRLAKQPIIEEDLLTGLFEPTNECYALAKITGIKLCQSLRKQYGFDAISLMPTNLYGPGDNFGILGSHVLPALIRKFYDAEEKNDSEIICWGTGKPRREFLHVNDLAEACVMALEKWDPTLEDAPKDKDNNPLTYLNVGTGVDITIKELVDLISKNFSFKGKVIWDQSMPDGTPQKKLDVTKIKSLGWTPKISLTDGISQTIDYFKLKVREGNIRQKF